MTTPSYSFSASLRILVTSAIRIAGLALTLIILATPAIAQRVDGRFTGVHEAGPQGEDLLRVRVDLRASDGSFDLGNASLIIAYNAEVVAFQSGAASNARLDAEQDYRMYPPFVASDVPEAPYFADASVFGSTGRVSVNLVLNTLGNGQLVEDTFIPVADIVFLVEQSGQEPELAWVVAPDANPTVIFAADNMTAIEAGNFGGEITSGVASEDDHLPMEFELSAAYPNPFNPQTTLEYALPKAETVQLMVFDVLGRRVATLVDDELLAGQHVARWHAEAYASGLYFARLTSGSDVRVRSLLLVK